MTARSGLHSARTVPEYRERVRGKGFGRRHDFRRRLGGSAVRPTLPRYLRCCPVCSLSQARYRSRPFSTS